MTRVRTRLRVKPAMSIRRTPAPTTADPMLAAAPATADPESGRALIEVVFLAVLLLVPTVYILASVMRIQAATFAVAQGARDAGRVMDSAPTVPAASREPRRSPGSRWSINECLTKAWTFGSSPRVVIVCRGPSSRRPFGPEMSTTSVSSLVVTFPGVPSVVTGSQNTVTGVFTLHVGDFREGQ